MDTSPSADADAGPALAILPPAYTVPIGRSQIFVAAGATSWTVVEGDVGGTVAADGTYTAPLVPGTYHVRADDGTLHGVATVTVADFRLGLVAGTLGGPGYIDDVGDLARMYQPVDLVGDGAGAFYFVDQRNHAIRKLDAATHAVTTLVGGPNSTGTVVDGIGDVARMYYPSALTIDRANGILYFTENGPYLVRKVVIATREVTTLAGNASSGYQDGIGIAVKFAGLTGIAFDGVDNVYLTDAGNCVVRRLALTSKTVSTPYGTAGTCTGVDGTTTATFTNPQRLLYVPSTIGGFDRIFVVDGSTVRMIAAGTVTTIAGSTTAGYVDAPGSAAQFHSPSGITTNGAGTLYLTDTSNCVIRTVDIAAPHAVGTYAGSGTGASDDGKGLAAAFLFPSGITFDGGALWVADTGNATIRSIDATKQVTTIAGKPQHRGATAGDFTASTLAGPVALAVDGTATLYATEASEVRTLALASQQTAALAGGPGLGRADGTGAAAKLHLPSGIALDPVAHLLYVADTSNNAIRRITLPGGVVDTPFNDIASATPSHIDDIGTKSRFASPTGLALVGGTLYVADSANNVIRAIELASGTTTTFAGSTAGIVDGIGAAAKFNGPGALATDGVHLFVGDDDGRLLRQIDLATAMVTTIAGSDGGSEHADGIGTAAHFSSIAALAWDGHDTLYAVDNRSQVVRRIYLPTLAVGTFAGLPFHGGVRMDSVTRAQLGSPTGIALMPSGAFELVAHDENAILQLVQQ